MRRGYRYRGLVAEQMLETIAACEPCTALEATPWPADADYFEVERERLLSEFLREDHMDDLYVIAHRDELS